MLPIGDGRAHRRIVPFFTYIFIIINLVVFYLELSRGDAFINRWAFIPSRFMADPGGQFITIYTSMFLHGGWMHLLSNMLYLWIFGDNVEDRFGHVKFIIFYLLSGTAATFTQYLFNTGSSIPLVGASGAIAGVLAAYVLMFPSRNVAVLMGFWVINVRAIFVIGLWFVTQLFSSYALIDSVGDMGGVAYLAHVGGFVAGFVLTLFLRKRNPR
jgi:membrane associated rhomboid family serine protease